MQPEAPRLLALFGGTFDPVHLGHLRVAWEAAEFLDAEVRLMPANVPPHRPQPQASAAQRLAMLRAALRGQDRLLLDDRELRREGPSYTVDTLTDLREEIGATRPVVLLVGADAWSGLPGWHRWQDLFGLAHIGVLTRAGHEPREPAELQRQVAARRTGTVADLADSAAGRVIDIRVSALEISATQVRNELAAGRQPRYLVSDALLAEPSLLSAYAAPGSQRD
ncbi:nicotinate-nucleotide adenylyltransferase [Dokdonella immobilis]|uniref:Probable nicotinate-nucleotide adenylyltransferase n=1 Tax=Dokdonella immobilis TaxID=578942 RepID=A0A1I4YGC5_9GAMM|nr:nicotinate-nucleotide adenylyltransferase [Dokdonella immobilis]SFN37057.1 nicotinate-nucleotide adenylyltransferase [Dokdonella immobilis]